MSSFFLPTKKSLRSCHTLRRYIIGIFLTIFFVFMGGQLWNIARPPTLKISSPSEGFSTTNPQVIVSGHTEAEALVEINGQPAFHEADGSFATPVDLQPGANTIFIRAAKKHGLFTTVSRNIILEATSPTIPPVSVIPQPSGDFN